jgi:putative holliday junction resolvase
MISIKGKRIAALDVGMVRIGVAVCDERHIVVSTRPVVMNDENVWSALNERFRQDRIDLVLVGIPERHDGVETPIIVKIRTFIDQLREHVALPIVEVDEAFSTARARETMTAIGTSKKRRSAKGTKDQMAAAVILQEFLHENRT